MVFIYICVYNFYNCSYFEIWLPNDIQNIIYLKNDAVGLHNTKSQIWCVDKLGI